MSKKMLREKIKKIYRLADGIIGFSVESEYISKNAGPGQFVNIKCGESDNPLLRRPISIMGVDPKAGTFDFVIQVKGIGTEILANMKEGDMLDFIGPLGNTFTAEEEYKKIAVVGGGIGIFPLLFLIESIKGSGKTVDAYLGFRGKENVILENEFRSASNELFISTNDGCYGCKGLVTDMLSDNVKTAGYDIIYTCGPMPMIKAVSRIAKDYGIPCQVSMEERMGCGFGACLVCACKAKMDDGTENYLHVCKEGPVFWADKMVFED